MTISNPFSFAALAATGPDARLLVVKNSVGEVRQMSLDPTYIPKKQRATLLRIKRNHVLFFSQALIHAGAGYWHDNIRVHVYFDHVRLRRNADETNPLHLRFGTKRAKSFVI
jgi:hypothetical protein